MHTTTLTPWVDRVWNPITGCRGTCEYCYLRVRLRGFSGDKRMNLVMRDRYRYTEDHQMIILDQKFVGPSGKTYTTPFRMEPTYHRYRLKNLDQVKTGMKIGVCLDGDMFGKWVPDEIITEIFKACEAHPRNWYIFTTRYPWRYRELASKGLLPSGDHYWYGSSVTGPSDDVFCDPRNDYRCFVEILPVYRGPDEIKLGSTDPVPDFSRTCDLGPFVINPHLDWVVVDELSPNTPRSYPRKYSIDINGIIEQTAPLCIPCYIADGFKDQVEESFRDLLDYKFPQEFSEVLLSEDKQKILYGHCMACKKEAKKKSMFPIITSPKRGTTVTLGYVCQDCWQKWCNENGIDKETAEYARARKTGE